MNQSATFSDRAEEIDERLDIMKELTERMLGQLAALHKDCVRTGQDWPAFVSTHFPAWGAVAKFAILLQHGNWVGPWAAYSALAPAQRALFDAQWREAHKPLVASEGIVVRLPQWH
jgi:hypothetical protein